MPMEKNPMFLRKQDGASIFKIRKRDILSDDACHMIKPRKEPIYSVNDQVFIRNLSLGVEIFKEIYHILDFSEIGGDTKVTHGDVTKLGVKLDCLRVFVVKK